MFCMAVACRNPNSATYIKVINMKILITGVAGFIGSALALRLLERGDTVYGIDNMNDYYDVHLKEARLKRTIDHHRFRFEKLDIVNRTGMAELFRKEKFDAVMHLAAQAGVRYSITNPDAYIDDVVEGVIVAIDRSARPVPAWSGNAPDPATSYAPYRIYNIGNNQPVELMRYIEVLEKCLGKKAKLEMLPMQDGDVPATSANVENLENDVGFRPRTSVEHGIARFVEWYRSYHGLA